MSKETTYGGSAAGLCPCCLHAARRHGLFLRTFGGKSGGLSLVAGLVRPWLMFCPTLDIADQVSSNNMTTLENLTHSYPSALLPDSPGTMTRTWKPDHLLTRSERYRLRVEASEINVYDLGWRRNLRNLLLGRDGDLWQAFWPLASTRAR